MRAKRALFGVAILLLLILAWTGISVGIGQFSQAHTPGQVAQTIAEFAFGVFAVLSLLTTFWARRWNRRMLACWAVSFTMAGALFYVAWIRMSLFTGILSGMIALVVALGIVWLHRVGTREAKEG